MARASSTNPFRTGHTLVIPHNGGDGDYPADSLAAYDASMAAGGEVVDIDVAKTRDGVFVAFHDATTDATTGIHGTVAEMTLAKLRTLNIGWGFRTPHGNHPFRQQPQRVPTVAEVLARFPHALVSLDLKYLDPDITGPLCVLLHTAHRTTQAFIGSKNPDQIITLRRQCPDVQTTLDPPEEIAFRRASRLNTRFVTPSFVDQTPYSEHSTNLVTPGLIAFAHNRNIALLTWVVDDEATMRRLVAMHVDGIYTRKPALLARIIRQSRRATRA